MNLHIAPADWQHQAGSTHAGHIEAFRDDLLKQYLARSARKVLTSLQIAAQGVETRPRCRGCLDEQRTSATSESLKSGRDIPTPAEVKRLIDAATDTKHRALLMTAALTGLRASELRACDGATLI